MIDPFWLALAFKIAVAAAVVVTASVLAQRSSPFIGAMIATLPVSAGPILAFLAHEHGAAYLAQSAVGAIAALAANGLFLTGYILASRRGIYGVALAAGLALWFGFLFAFDVAHFSLAQALLAVAVIYAGGILLTRRYRHAVPPRPAARVWYDLPLRVVGVGCLAAAVGLVGQRAGAAVSGYIAVFPVVFSSLSLIVHVTAGPKVAAAVLANSFEGLAGFVVALAFVHLSAVRLGGRWRSCWGLACACCGILRSWCGAGAGLTAAAPQRAGSVLHFA